MDHGIETQLPADLVIDASGRGHLIAAVLQCMGHERPRETVVGIDLRYTTMIAFRCPMIRRPTGKLVLTHPRRATVVAPRFILLPMEGDRWMLSAMGRGKQEAAGGLGLAAAVSARQLTTPTIYNAVRNLMPIGEPDAFCVLREHLAAFRGGRERFPMD